MGFPGGSDGKESACDARDLGSIPGLGRFPGEGNGNLLQFFWLENPHGQRSLAGYSPWSHKELDTTERLSTAQYYNFYCIVSLLVLVVLSIGVVSITCWVVVSTLVSSFNVSIFSHIKGNEESSFSPTKKKGATLTCAYSHDSIICKCRSWKPWVFHNRVGRSGYYPFIRRVFHLMTPKALST